MIELTRSRSALALGGVGALLLALGEVLSLVGYATLSPDHPSTFHDIVQGSVWVTFAGMLLVFAAAAGVAWVFVLARRYGDLWEVGLAAAATLLVAIGALLAATEVFDGSSQASNVVTALGFGGWALLALGIAAVRSFGETRSPGQRRASPYWLVAAGSLLLVAISAGLPASSSGDSVPGVVAGILSAVGVAVLVVTFGVARSRQLIVTRSFPVLAAALAAFVVWQVSQAVAAGTLFAPSATLTTARVVGSVTGALGAIAYALLGQASWLRMREAPATFDPRATAPAGAAGHGFPGAQSPPWMPQSGQVPHAFPGAGAPGGYPPPPPGHVPPPSGYAQPQDPRAPAPQAWTAVPPAAPPPPAATRNPAAAPPGVAQEDPVAPRAPGQRLLAHCGEPVPEGAMFCPRCGTRLGSPPPAPA